MQKSPMEDYFGRLYGSLVTFRMGLMLKQTSFTKDEFDTFLRSV